MVPNLPLEHADKRRALRGGRLWAEFVFEAHGAAYTSRQDRYGVPLDHVAEKLSSAIEELHRFGQDHADDRAGLLPAMHYALVAHLGLHNILGKAGDRTLASRLLNGSSKELRAWLDVVEPDQQSRPVVS